MICCHPGVNLLCHSSMALEVCRRQQLLNMYLRHTLCAGPVSVDQCTRNCFRQPADRPTYKDFVGIMFLSHHHQRAWQTTAWFGCNCVLGTDLVGDVLSQLIMWMIQALSCKRCIEAAVWPDLPQILKINIIPAALYVVPKLSCAGHCLNLGCQRTM